MKDERIRICRICNRGDRDDAEFYWVNAICDLCSDCAHGRTIVLRQGVTTHGPKRHGVRQEKVEHRIGKLMASHGSVVIDQSVIREN